MARLYLRCALCDRQQADGLLSGAAWRKLDVPGDVGATHPALSGSALRACPTCVQRHPDWEHRLLSALGLTGGEAVTDAA